MPSDTKHSPDDVAADYVGRWENVWNSQGAAAAAKLYTPDSMLIGVATAIGQPEIAKLLGMLYEHGWTTIALRIINAHAVDDLVLAACEFTAQGSGPTEGKTMTGRSSHVLTRIDGTWLSAMHTTTRSG